jgi:hypothetical protein
MNIMNKIFLILMFAFITLSGIGQTSFGISVDRLCINSVGNKEIEGEIFVNKKYYKHFAVLFRDTCNPMNRISNCYFRKVMICPGDFYYPALLIDSVDVEMVEQALLTWLHTASRNTQNFYNTRKRSFFNYIRCYGGFVDEVGDKYVVVQLLTKKEFHKNGFYRYRFDLFALRTTSRLRFLIVKIKSNKAFVQSFFL